MKKLTKSEWISKQKEILRTAKDTGWSWDNIAILIDCIIKTAKNNKDVQKEILDFAEKLEMEDKK